MKRSYIITLSIFALVGLMLGGVYATYQTQIQRDVAFAQPANPADPSDTNETTIIPANETPDIPEAENEELVDAPVEDNTGNEEPDVPTPPTVPELPVNPGTEVDPITNTPVTPNPPAESAPITTNPPTQNISDVLTQTERSGGAETAIVIVALLSSLGVYMYYRHQHYTKREMVVEGAKPKPMKRKKSSKN